MLGTLFARICSQKTLRNWNWVQSVPFPSVQLPQVPTFHLQNKYIGHLFLFFFAPWTTWILIAGFLFFGLEVWVTETLVHPFKSFLKTYLASKRLVPLTFAEQNISLVLVPPPQGALHSPGGPVTQAYPPEEPGKLLSNQLL